MPKVKATRTPPPGWERRRCCRCGKSRLCLFTTNPYHREMILNLDIEDLPQDWYCSSCLAYLHDEV